MDHRDFVIPRALEVTPEMTFVGSLSDALDEFSLVLISTVITPQIDGEIKSFLKMIFR